METPVKHVQKGVLETFMKSKEILQPEFSSSQSMPDLLEEEKGDPDQVISMRKEDFERLVMERSQHLVKEKEKGKGLFDPDPVAGLARDNEAPKCQSRRGAPGCLEQDDEAESRTPPPPRPRSPAKVGLWVEGLGVPMTRLPLGDNLQELIEQIEIATKKLEEMKRRGAVTSVMQKAQDKPAHKQDLERRSRSRLQERKGRVWTKGPKDLELEIALKLEFGVTNNEAEYEALIAGIKLAQKCQAKKLVTYTDSQLVAMQVQGEYEAKENTMVAYLERVKQLIGGFEEFQIH
ncbi:hypothetical protein DH2020_016785 [Rehmannia glutinosa]|uniref:RNase H type-1 domain-containing protein n=1 Tax=Rehmannia glutinosa TaxID=99300 RepID=A0ABR0WSV0_REHGL